MNNQKTDFKEVVVECIGCGKKIKAIKRKGAKADKFICQRCAKKELTTELS